MRIRFPNLQNADLDEEQADGVIVTRAWRDAGYLAEMQGVLRAPRENRAGKELRIHLKYNYNSDAGSVPWQEAALNW